jgi:hypothetical protein
VGTVASGDGSGGAAPVTPKPAKPAGDAGGANASTPPIDETPFPFSVRSILEMCWGMTMNLSHETQQQTLGNTFTTQLNQIFTAKENSLVNADFLQNLRMAIFGSLRTLAFVRENHKAYLDYTNAQATSRHASVESIADLASFSGSGLYAKLGSFIGVGSVASVVSTLKYPPYFILIFAGAGILAALIVTWAVHRQVSKTESTWDDKILKLNNEYWIKFYRPDMTDQLYHLYLDIKALVSRFYPDLVAKDDLLGKSDDEVKKFIQDNILPPENLQWHPSPTSSPTSAQASTAAPASQGTGKGGSTSTQNSSAPTS